jgi:Tol biopolymer transport system component
VDLEDRLRASLRDRASGVTGSEGAWQRIEDAAYKRMAAGPDRRRLAAALVALAVAGAGIGFAIVSLARVRPAGGRPARGIVFVKTGEPSGPGVDNTEISSINPDGSGLSNLTNSPGAESSVAWSPGGREAVFVRTSFAHGTLTSGVFVMNGDGTNAHEVLPCREQRCEFSDFAWSPDGARIALVERGKGGTVHDRIEVMNADGSDRREICSFPRCDQAPRAPVWSPDGRELAFSGQGSLFFLGQGLSPSALYVADADGGGVRKLSNLDCRIGHDPVGPCPYLDSAPAWSSEGRWIAFSRHMAGIGRDEPVPPGSPSGQNSQIVLIRPDGSDAHVLATCRGGVYCRQVMAPVWSPDGTRVAFVDAVDKHSVIRVVGVSGNESSVLSTCSGGRCPDPENLRWSPDGTALAFTSGVRTESLYRIGLEGPAVVLARGVDGCCLAWLPGQASTSISDSAQPSGEHLPTALPSTTGPRLAGLIAFGHFAGSDEGNPDVYVVGADSQPAKLTSNPEFDGEPAWSPDGTKIAFASYRPGTSNTNVWVMNADGSGQRPLTHIRTGATQPAWSPDGTRIAFVADGPKSVPSIWVMNADGTGQGRISTPASGDSAPAWSPDGTLIAFDRSAGDDGAIWVVRPDGTGLRKVTDPGGEGRPAWSPDGSRIAFVWFTAGGNDLYVVDADGTGLRRLTNLEGSPESPNWSPDGTQIVFSYGVTAFRGGIYTVEADGRGLNFVAGGSGGWFEPSWQPAR